jgi:hypothetical protein
MSVIANDVWFNTILPKCELKELLSLRGLNKTFREKATEFILQKKAREIYAHCSPKFIISYVSAHIVDVSYFTVKHRLGRIEPELLKFIINELTETEARKIICTQRIEPDELHTFMLLCRSCFSTDTMHDINNHQTISPELLMEFQDIIPYETIHKQPHLSTHLRKLRKQYAICNIRTKWDKLPPDTSIYEILLTSSICLLLMVVLVPPNRSI